MNTWEIKEIFEQVIAYELLKLAQNIESMEPQSLPHDREYQITEHVMLYIDYSPAFKSLALRSWVGSGIGRMGTSVFSIKDALHLAKEMLLDIGYEPKAAWEVMEKIRGIRAHFWRGKNA